LPHLFNHHALAVTEFLSDAAAKPNNEVTVVLCALLFLLTIVMVLFRRRYTLHIRSLYSQRFYSLLLRESKVLEEMMFPVTLLFDLLTISLGILMILMHLNPLLVDQLTFWGAYAAVFASMLVIYFLSFAANVIYTGLFDHQKERYSLNLYKFIFASNVALVAFPVLVVCHALREFAVMYALIPLFLVLLALYVYRLFKINPKKINLFQFFLYFCTLEILPYLLWVKFISII